MAQFNHRVAGFDGAMVQVGVVQPEVGLRVQTARIQFHFSMIAEFHVSTHVDIRVVIAAEHRGNHQQSAADNQTGHVNPAQRRQGAQQAAAHAQHRCQRYHDSSSHRRVASGPMSLAANALDHTT